MVSLLVIVEGVSVYTKMHNKEHEENIPGRMYNDEMILYPGFLEESFNGVNVRCLGIRCLFIYTYLSLLIGTMGIATILHFVNHKLPVTYSFWAQVLTKFGQLRCVCKSDHKL